jgi:mono/diheme cytochrome c family protein
VSRRKIIPAGGPLLALAVAVVGSLILSGCGVSTQGDFDRGKQLFAARCATCHTLKDAGTQSTLGPDLDVAFAQARASGMDPETIAGVVKNQVENPRPSTSNPAVSMPADIVTGTELEDVASYLGTVAGNPDIKAPQLPDDPGAQIFAQNGCSSCHTMAAADASGTVGPDLDEAVPTLKTAGAVKEAIVDPNKVIAPGFPENVMPETYGQDLSPQELDQLVQFLLKYSGPKAGSAGGGPGGGGAAGGGSSKSGGSSK